MEVFRLILGVFDHTLILRTCHNAHRRGASSTAVDFCENTGKQPSFLNSCSPTRLSTASRQVRRRCLPPPPPAAAFRPQLSPSTSPAAGRPPAYESKQPHIAFHSKGCFCTSDGISQPCIAPFHFCLDFTLPRLPLRAHSPPAPPQRLNPETRSPMEPTRIVW